MLRLPENHHFVYLQNNFIFKVFQPILIRLGMHVEVKGEIRSKKIKFGPIKIFKMPL